MPLPPGRRLVSWLLLLLPLYGHAQAGVLPLVVPAEAGEAFHGPVELMGYAGGIAVEWEASPTAPVDYYAVERIVDGTGHIVATFTPRASEEALASYRFIDQGDYEPGLAFKVRAAYRDGSYAETAVVDAGLVHDRRSRLLGALDEETLARLYLRLDSDLRQDVVVEVATLTGDPVATFSHELLTGRNDLHIDYSGWREGYYSVGLTDAATQRHEWLIHVDPARGVASARRLPGSPEG